MSKTIENTYFVKVDKDGLQFNHADKLSYWLGDDFELFRDRISVDNYLAIQKDRRQFYPFAMCREATSDNYMNSKSAYYITLDEAKAIVKYMEKSDE